MRKIAIALVVLLLAAGFAGAQTPPSFDDYENTIQSFADGVASSLPLNSAVGLTWSDAYIGGFPHLGVGAAVGFSTIPWSSISPITDALGLTDAITSSEAFGYIQEFGAPLPAYDVEARLGGLILPFDVGVKFGTIPEGVNTADLTGGIQFDYLLAGANARLRLIEENILLPEVSVGGGYNRLDASIRLPSLIGENIQITSFTDPRDDATYDIELSDPSLEYFWSANVFDFQVQASKNILLFTPYAGAGASLGVGQAGGGLYSELITTPNIDDSEWAAINEALAATGQDTLPEFSEDGTGFSVTADMPAGWGFRVFGGVSLNLLLLKVDVSAMYDLIGQNYGVTLGTRIQL